MEKRLLFVDDEKSILNSLERIFFDTDYEVFTAESGEEGLRILGEYPVDVVVSDMRMPIMDGTHFLQKVKSLYPHTTRLILSGYADEKEILNSLIEGVSNVYLFKPWDSTDLQEKIAKVFEIRKVFSNQALLDIANGLENLSLVTGIYNSVCRLIEEEASIGAIAKIIETDPTVTAAVLRIVNSAFFNVKTASLSQAINFLGMPVIKSIVLSCSLFKSVNIKVPPYTSAKLANHANKSNFFMKQIYSEILHKPLPDSIATAGLIHNLGFVLCLHYFPENYNKILAEYVMRQKKTSLPVLEKELLKVTHSELGGYLLHWWGLPYPVVECALFHHDPLNSAVINKEAVCAVNIANHYAWKAIDSNVASSVDEGVFIALGIEERDCNRVLLN